MTTDLPLASVWRSLQIPPVKPDLHISEKSPALSFASGTVAVNAWPVRSRKPSQLKNQNVLLRPPLREKFIGPPAFAPNWFCTQGGLDFPPALRKKSLALNILLRTYSYASPCNEFVPDFVLKLVTPPENLPHSGPRLLVCTLNSCIESCVGIRTGR